METVEPLVLVRQSSTPDDESKPAWAHQGLARTLMNHPCMELPLLTHFQKAPYQMLDEIRGFNHFESQSEKLARKLNESPFFGIGLALMAGVCAAGAYRFRRGLVTLPPPQYLMQLRVAAQSACVGSVVAGTAYTMVTKGQPDNGA